MIRVAISEDAPQIARVHVDSWRTTYAGILPDDLLAGLSYAQREEMWGRTIAAGRSAVFVAELAGEVVGFAACGRNREEGAAFDAELYAIYLLREAQGHGLGRALVQTAAHHLIAQGFNSMVLWVAADNPARRFYEALGGRYLGERVVDVGGVDLREAQYGWDGLAGLT